ncbi:MAG: acetylxylan esterase [Planctomycetes bacterium]|nr:acetylxylan esterase [Planctomycetota bacterium]
MILLLALVLQEGPVFETSERREFTNARQQAELEFSRKLDGLSALTVGAWVRPKRSGEQVFFSRGLPEAGPNGERMFRPKDGWVNFMLGTDGHGFLMGTIHGNGSLPFPFVTLNEVPIGSWSQLVIVKDAAGFQKFYRNGSLVCSDRESCHAGTIRPFRDREPGEPLRLSMPLGGTTGEAWIFPRELSPDEIRKDFEAKRLKYAPALPAEPVLLRAMDSHPGSWKEPVSAETWPKTRERILEGMRKIFCPMPTDKVSLDPQVISEEDCGNYLRRKVSIQVQPGDRMPAYLLVPKQLKSRVPAIVCFYGTTSGAGKETTVGLSGGRPGSPPEKNRAFAVDMVEAGFVAFAADYLRDGERISPGKRPYDTTEFYAKFPDWSIHGKDAWDTMRAIDYLQTLDFVDPENIGMAGHSYGGHSTIFTAAFEPRIKAAWANGPVSDFLQHGLHWAAPKGGGSSQSLPAMRPYVLDRTLPPPLTFYEVTSLIAPRALAVGQAVGERRPMEEENCAAVGEAYACSCSSRRRPPPSTACSSPPRPPTPWRRPVPRSRSRSPGPRAASAPWAAATRRSAGRPSRARTSRRSRGPSPGPTATAPPRTS